MDELGLILNREFNFPVYQQEKWMRKYEDDKMTESSTTTEESTTQNTPITLRTELPKREKDLQ